MRKYRVVRRDQDIRFLVEAIEASGGKILQGPSKDAPFEIEVLSPSGEDLNLICYAFHANKYRQAKRPKDEHRLQIKYGSQFDRYHEISIGDRRQTVTLLFGIHRECGVFIALDPVMNNPTRFSKSIEFKDHHLDSVQEEGGWFGWERERSTGRRRQSAPLWNYQTEVLLGFHPDRFFDYIEFERIATGLDPGLRLLLIEKFGRPPFRQNLQHPLAQELGLAGDRILDLIDDTFRLKVAVRGSVAEEHLRRQLNTIEGMDEITVLDEDGQPDFRVRFRGGPPVFIECKNVLRRRSKNRIKVDFQKTRASMRDPCTRYYKASDFEVLAACLFPVTETWSFRFQATQHMAPHSRCPGRLSHRVFVDEPGWSSSIESILLSLR